MGYRSYRRSHTSHDNDPYLMDWSMSMIPFLIIASVFAWVFERVVAFLDKTVALIMAVFYFITSIPSQIEAVTGVAPVIQLMLAVLVVACLLVAGAKVVNLSKNCK